LTRIIIDVTREIGYKGPNLCLRVTETMPQELWDASMDSVATGNGLPVFYSDGLYIDALVGHGIPLEAARGYCLAGCSQLMVPGMCNFYNDIGIYNAAKVAELTMYGGYDPRAGIQAGPPTKPAVECETFDELMEQFWMQLDYFVKMEVDIHNVEAPYRRSRDGYVMRTLFMRDCISAGKNVFDGGARYNNIELEIIGITNAADHLYAVKHLVYDNDICSMSELTEALANNWSGYEPLRRYIIEKTPKFGNDHSGPDDLRGAIAERLYRLFNESPSVIGGVFVPGEVIFVAHEYCGFKTGATADGRYAYSVLADSAGASQGFDLAGPTALMNSVLKTPAKDYLLTSVVLNIRFLPDVFAGARGKIQALFRAFFGRGGMQVQVNVYDSETLREAQANPDAYRSLIVRVGGYSDYFTRLSRALQDEIINRTAQRM
jgi:formate C-acetyltransferase